MRTSVDVNRLDRVMGHYAFAKRQIAEMLVSDHRLPVQRACRVVGLSRAAFYRPPVPASRRDAVVIAALTDVVAGKAIGLDSV